MERDLLTEIQDDYKHPKRKKREKKVEKGTSISRILISAIFVVVLIVTGVAYVLEQYVNWRAEHEWQFPAQWIGMVRIIERQTISPVANAQTKEPMTDQQIIEQYSLSPVLKTVYFLESTSGQKDGCKDEGKFNGYGYAQNSNQWKCYDSFEIVTEKVNEWYEDRLATNGNDLIEAVCYYNTGVQGQLSCGDYSANFFSVLTKNF